MVAQYLRAKKVRRVVSAGVISSLVASGLVVLAALSDGFVNTAVNLTDSSVWVTNGHEQIVGRVNKPIEELNSSVAAPSADFDVLQDGEMVLVSDGAKGELKVLDVMSVTLGSKIDLPGNALITLGGGALGVADVDSGDVWIGRTDQLRDFDPATAQPAATLAAGVVITASLGGTVFAAAPAGSSITALEVGADGLSMPPTSISLSNPALSASSSGADAGLSITAVGSTPVVLDRTAGVVIVNDNRIPVPDAATAILQQPGADASSVLVATATALLRLPLDGGDAETVVDGMVGVPAAPVFLRGCAHAAWGGDPAMYAVACGSDPVRTIAVPKADSTSRLTFRVNRTVIVLNDELNGNTWLVDQDMTLINNWDDVRRDQQEDLDDEGADESNTTIETASPECDGTLDTPAPVNDQYGVRAGRSTLLRVMDNDAAPECAAFAISSFTSLPPDVGIVSLVQNSTALQVELLSGSTSVPELQYVVSDGAGHNASAAVQLSVTPDSEHAEPKAIRFSKTVVEISGTISYNVLGDWISPSGDDLRLAGASATTADDEVTYRPDGTITFRDKGTQGIGKKKVSFTITDGTKSAEGELSVDVRGAGTAVPYAAPVFARAVVGEPVTIWPLRSVLSPAADPLRLTGVTKQADSADVAATPNATEGTITAIGSRPGTFYLNYSVSAGGADGTGVLRVDVVDVTDPNAAPVAMTDIAYLVDGRSVQIDPTVNDVDPRGGVLALQDVRASAADEGLTVTTTDLHLVQIASTRPLPESGSVISYVVNNGSTSSTGQIRVLPVPVSSSVPPPDVLPIAATVRAGDAMTIQIGQYASDPSGEKLTLQPWDEQPLAAEQGLLFTDGMTIRYLAPATPPTQPVRFSYTVRNLSGKKATAVIDVQVTQSDPEHNQAPSEPQVAVARVFANRVVDISLPLDGIDRDGDWVTLSGIGAPSPNSLGLASVSGTGALRFEAFDRPGLDSVSYTATDTFGASVTGIVKIVVVPAPSTSRPPVAPNLDVAVRPSRVIGIDALTEVLDPADSTIAFGTPAIDVPDAWKSRVTLTDGLIVVTAPPQPEIQSLTYRAENEAGLSASGLVTVQVAVDAVILPPTAKDAFITKDEIVAGTTTATISVEDLITNPSGQASDLVLSMDPGAAGQATIAGREVTTPILENRQVLAYRVSNELDGLVAKAFLVVPSQRELGLDDSVIPQLRTDVEPLTVEAGATVDVIVADYVTVGTGTPEIPDGHLLTASQNGLAGRLDSATFRYTPTPTSAGPAVVSVPIAVPAAAPRYINIPVTITPKAYPPPTFSAVDLPVEVGGTATVDLKQMVAVAPGQTAPLDFQLVGSPSADGFGISLSGSVVTATVDTDTPKNTTATITAQVRDGADRPWVDAVIAVRATASNKPLPRVGSFTIPDGAPSVVATQSVLDGAFDPFGEGLTVTEAVVESGAGSAVGFTDGTVSVTPTAVGTIVVRYTVLDGTKDTDRAATGRLTVQVQDKPEAPGTPSIVQIASHTVQLAWTDRADNGLPITEYRARDAAQGVTFGCPGNPCTVTGLTNATTYSFTIEAMNSRGWSEPSGVSAPATPDQVPDQPAPPLAQYSQADKLVVSWTPPRVDGSPIIDYLVQISPADLTGGSTATVTGTTLTWFNLQNGTDYTFTVTARNSAGSSVGSFPSVPEHPSAPPSPPQNLTVTFGPGDFTARQLTVAWSTPADTGGDPVTQYIVSYTSAAGSGDLSPVGPGVFSSPITGVSDTEYTVIVHADNRSGAGAASPPQRATPFSPPSQVTGVSAAATGNSGQVQVSWATATGSGKTVDHYNIYSDGGTRSGDIFGTTGSVSGLSNGVDHTFTVSASYSSAEASFNQEGLKSSPAAIANPYFPLGNPSVSGSVNANVITFTWTWPADNGRHPEQNRGITGVSGANTGGASGSWSQAVNFGESRSITLQTCDTTGVCRSASTSASTPPPRVEAYFEGPISPIGKCLSNCYWVKARLYNFAPGSTVTCVNGGEAPQNVGINGSGYGEKINNYWYSGFNPQDVTCNGVTGYARR